MPSTVPGWRSEPSVAEPPQGALCGVGVGAVEEEAVERGAGAGDVRAEGSGGPDLGCERRAREVVRRERGEVVRGSDSSDGVEELLASFVPAAGPVARVEDRVYVRGRGLGRVAREKDD